MKKLFVIVFCLATLSGKAQNIEMGAKGGINFSSLNGDDVEGLDGRTSFHLGLLTEIAISERFSIQPELLYSAAGASAAEGEGVIRLDYLNLPVLAKVYLIEGLSLEAGPQIGFNVVAEAEDDGEKEEIDDIESTEWSAAFGLGYELPAGFFLQGRYNLGLTEVWEFVELKSNVLQLSVGYKF